MISSNIRPDWTRSCIANHSGVWAVEPGFARSFSAAVMHGKIEPRQTDAADGRDGDMWSVREDGLGVLYLSGPMQKFESKHGGFNTNRARRVIRNAMTDSEVRAVMILVDSPGGSADGTMELAEDVSALAAVKPTATHVSGMMASAALWVGTQTGRVTAWKADMVGSIGTYAAVYDWSGMYEKEGVTVEVIAAGGSDEGGVKGAGVDGVPLTDEYRAEVRNIVNSLNDLFVAGVANGRGMTNADARKLADGRMHMAPAAVALGLVDAIVTPEQAAADLMALVEPRSAGRSVARARARMDLDRHRIG
jgi:signal peptide peptidase SppA